MVQNGHSMCKHARALAYLLGVLGALLHSYDGSTLGLCGAIIDDVQRLVSWGQRCCCSPRCAQDLGL